MTCGAIYNHGCVMGDTCERVAGHAGDHGPAILDSLLPSQTMTLSLADLASVALSASDYQRFLEEAARLRSENAALRAAVETAAAMVRKADPDLADALLRQINEPTIVRST